MSHAIRRQAIEDAVQMLTIAGVELSFSKDETAKRIAGACSEASAAGKRALAIWNEPMPSVMNRDSKSSAGDAK